MIDVIDSMITGCIDPKHIPKKKTNTSSLRCGMQNPPDDAKQIPRDSDLINLDKNHHNHTFTCAKCKKKYKGKRICRLAMKRPQNDESA